MKLFVFAALIAVSYAGRLEHLEQQNLRTYLPPVQKSFGAIPGAYGTLTGPSQPGVNARANYPSTSNQYLPPDHGPLASAPAGAPAFAGSIYGFNGQNQQFGQQPTNQYSQDASPQGSNPYGAQVYQPQPAANSQYPHHSSQDIPQQAFDEQTGYHY